MFLDTSGLLCLLHRSEAQHAAARDFYAAANQRLTHSLVLAEFVALCTIRKLPRVSVLEFVEALLENPAIEVEWIDQAVMQNALELLQNRADKGYSWCDAVSFVVMR